MTASLFAASAILTTSSRLPPLWSSSRLIRNVRTTPPLPYRGRFQQANRSPAGSGLPRLAVSAPFFFFPASDGHAGKNTFQSPSLRAQGVAPSFPFPLHQIFSFFSGPVHNSLFIREKRPFPRYEFLSPHDLARPHLERSLRADLCDPNTPPGPAVLLTHPLPITPVISSPFPCAALDFLFTASKTALPLIAGTHS